MIDEAKLKELREHWEQCDHDCGAELDDPDCPIDFDDLADTIEALWKVARAAEVLAKQFKAIQEDHHEKLVHNQTFESAQENWDDLKQGPLEFGPLLDAIAALREGK